MLIVPSGPGSFEIQGKTVTYFRHGKNLQITSNVSSQTVSKIFFELYDFNICLAPSRVQRLCRGVRGLIHEEHNGELLRKHWQPVFWKLLNEGQSLSDTVRSLYILSHGWLKLRIKPKHPRQRYGVKVLLNPTIARWISRRKADAGCYVMGFLVRQPGPLKDRARELRLEENAGRAETRERDTSVLQRLRETIRCLFCGNRMPVEEVVLPWKCVRCRAESFTVGWL